MRFSIQQYLRLIITLLCAALGVVEAPGNDAPPLPGEPPLGHLIEDLKSPDGRKQALALQRLARLGPRAAAPLVPLLDHPDGMVAHSAFAALMSIANEACAPGRGEDCRAVADALLPLLEAGQPDDRRRKVLRIVERALPDDANMHAFIALILEGGPLRDPARTALERNGGTSARAALRVALGRVEPEYQPAVLNSLAALGDRDSAVLAWELAVTEAAAMPVRLAALRVLACTGDPAYLDAAWRIVAQADTTQRPEAIDGLLRLLDGIVRAGGNWEHAAAGYRRVLALESGPWTDAALAALGRIGDGGCVAPMLAVIAEATMRTRLVGLRALQEIGGREATAALVEAYPHQSEAVRLSLLPVLGARRSPLCTPLLLAAAEAEDATARLLALDALGRNGDVAAVAVLAGFAAKAPPAEQEAARRALFALADQAQAAGQAEQAGEAYLAVLAAAGDEESRRRALRGIAASPLVAAYEVVRSAVDDPALHQDAVAALLAVAEALHLADERDKAAAAFALAAERRPDMQTLQRAARGLSELGVEFDWDDKLGVIRHWWALGPFELAPDNQGWDRDWIGEPNVELSRFVVVGDATYTWQPVRGETIIGVVDLRQQLADRDSCVGYVYTELIVERGGPAVLRLGVDDSEKVWVNGEKVYEQFTARGLVPDQDLVPVMLRPGVNQILLKVWQHMMGWEFCARLTTEDGAPIAFQRQAETTP